MMFSRRGFSRGLALLLMSLACLPVCAQKAATRSPLSNRANSSEIENPSALSGFFVALANASSGRCIEPVRVMHFGDSHVAADVLTAEIRGNLQSQFGDGGAGYIVPRNPMNTRRRGVLTGATQGWQIEGIGGRLESDGIYGPGGISLATSYPNDHS